MTDARPVIGFANSNKSWGGGEKWFAEVIEKLSPDFTIKAYVSAGSPLYYRLSKLTVDIRTVSIGNLSSLNPIKLFRLSRQLRKDQLNLLIMNMPADVKAIGIAARIAGIPNRVYRRGSAIPIRNSFVNRWLFKHIVQAMISNSNATTETILANNPLLFPREKIHLIYNGIDLRLFDEKMLQAVDKKVRQPLIIGNAGRIVHQKGHELIVELAGLLETKGLDFIIKIAGDGPGLSALKAFVSSKQLDPYFEFAGFVEHIPSFMSQLDLYIHTAHWEGFGYVLAEAMAASVPVVAFKVSSNFELVEDGSTGFLVDYPYISAMADKVITLHKDPVLCKEMSKKGRRRIEQYFTLEKMVDQTRKFIDGKIQNTV